MAGHGIVLLASINLAKRSRIQDLWIFGAPAPAPSTPDLLARRRTPVGFVLADDQPLQAHSMIQHKDSNSNLPLFPSSLPPRQTGHLRSASNPQNSPHAMETSSLGRSVSASRALRKPAPLPISPTTPARAQDDRNSTPSPSRIQFVAARNGPTSSTPIPPTLIASPLPSGYPEYPPNPIPVSPYSANHQPDVIYTTSRSPEPVYQHVPSSAFQVPGLPAASNAPSERRPAAVPTGIPPRPPPPLQQSSWEEQVDQPFVEERPDTPGDLLSPTAFRDTGFSTDSNNQWNNESQSLSGNLARDTFTDSGVVDVKHAIDENHQADDVLARSPRIVRPELLPDEVNEARPRSEKALLGFIHPPPPPPLFPAENARHAEDIAIVASPVAEETPTPHDTILPPVSPAQRHSMEVPMTVRDSDMGAGEAWVVVHESGTISPNAMKSSVPREPTLPPGAAKPVPPIRAIPSDGDQNAYNPRIVSNSRKGFAWSSKSRREKKERENAAVVRPPSVSSRPRSPNASTPSVDSSVKPPSNKRGIFRRKPSATTAPNNRLTID